MHKLRSVAALSLFFSIVSFPYAYFAEEMSAGTALPPFNPSENSTVLDLTAALQPIAVAPSPPSENNIFGNEHLIQKPWWFTLGSGIGGLSEQGGTGGGLSADVSVDYAPEPNQILTIRATGMNNSGGPSIPNMDWSMSGSGTNTRLDTFISGLGDVGTLYGYRHVTNWGYLSASGGLAWAMGRKYPTQTGQIGQGFNTLGVPLEGDAFYNVNSDIALGLIAFADVNPQASYAGITLAVQLGQLKAP